MTQPWQPWHHGSPRCGQFNFAPLDLSKGTGLRTVDSTGQQVSSWGGSVHIADDGKMHMWAAEMSNSVGIKAWVSSARFASPG